MTLLVRSLSDSSKSTWKSLFPARQVPQARMMSPSSRGLANARRSSASTAASELLLSAAACTSFDRTVTSPHQGLRRHLLGREPCRAHLYACLLDGAHGSSSAGARSLDARVSLICRPPCQPCRVHELRAVSLSECSPFQALPSIEVHAGSRRGAPMLVVHAVDVRGSIADRNGHLLVRRDRSVCLLLSTPMQRTSPCPWTLPISSALVSVFQHSRGLPSCVLSLTLF